MHKSNWCFKLELEWAVFSYKLPLKSKKVIQKRKKLHEIRKLARRTKSCSKSEKLLKSCRATYGQPYWKSNPDLCNDGAQRIKLIKPTGQQAIRFFRLLFQLLRLFIELRGECDVRWRGDVFAIFFSVWRIYRVKYFGCVETSNRNVRNSWMKNSELSPNYRRDLTITWPSFPFTGLQFVIDRFTYDLEMKQKQHKNGNRAI